MLKFLNISAHALECQRTWQPRRISRQKFPKRTRILSLASKPHSFHSVHSAIGSRLNGMIFRSFRKRNSSQKNTKTVYSEYSYSGIVPKESALTFRFAYLIAIINRYPCLLRVNFSIFFIDPLSSLENFVKFILLFRWKNALSGHCMVERTKRIHRKIRISIRISMNILSPLANFN